LKDFPRTIAGTKSLVLEYARKNFQYAFNTPTNSVTAKRFGAISFFEDKVEGFLKVALRL
jgi:hypothetical protein